ncbi:hypothetical protein JTE90_025042 [Oedothorax gibbosus]|uniref:Rhabdovirus nucleocapsid domain-containing protein n=1 Tax=Oedothorax gibbosus TaxID=931172 RepID=A0AAV6TTD5_9ARAC|nr:hypothetical protein JTE90_025042 [Oedothorax gibbosus]
MKTNNPNQHNEGIQRLDNFLKTSGFGVSEDDLKLTRVLAIESSLTIQFRKCIAAIDMFLNQLPTCPARKKRICTIPSRYRGCTVLTSMRQLAEIMGLRLGELMYFCFTDPPDE